MSCGFCTKLSNFMWANQKDMMQHDHTKPAPWLSHQTLLLLRITLSFTMLVVTIGILIITGGKSFIYLSQWSLLLTTLTFGLLALAQIRSHKQRLEEISLADKELSHDNTQIINANAPFSSYKWIVFFYQLAFSLNWVVFLFFYYVLIFGVLNPKKYVDWWDIDSTIQRYI